MTRRHLATALLCLSPVCLLAQDPAPPAAQQPAATVPVRRVVLYKTGVGYFEHLGTVRGRQDVTIRFTSAQLNDVLKSLTTIDLGKGQIAGISYNSVAPLQQQLGALRLPLDRAATTFQLLESLRGSRVEVTANGAATVGRLLNVEIQQRAAGGETVNVETFSILTDAGEIRRFEHTPGVRVRILERDLRQEVSRYLDLVGSSRERDVRSMVIATAGTGERPLFVSYISEVPIWKSTYRLVLPAKADKPLLQGWAIVDNTIGEDWKDVELSLVAGAPQSFIQQISLPYYGQRPVVPLPRNVLMTPQTHQPTLVSGASSLRGTVRDQAGAPLPGVVVRLIGAGGDVVTATTDPNGDYQINAPAGIYGLVFSLAGFRTERVDSVNIKPGETARQNATLVVGSLSETVSVMADSARPGGVVGGVVGGMPSPPPPPAPLRRPTFEQLQNVAPAATGAELGDLFEYRIQEPVTLRKNQSALVPIVNARIAAEKVSLWNRASGSGRPLRAVWITNATGLTLDGGSITVIDGNAFAGEGLIEPLKANERRLVSYAADLGVLVAVKTDGGPSRIFRVRARDGILIQETEDRSDWTYTARSEEDTPTTLVIEHPQRAGWKLAGGQTPEESTPSTHRFRITIPARQEAALRVREIRSGEARISIGEVHPALIARMAAAGVPVADLERALKPVLDKRTELSEVQQRIQTLEQRQQTITADQERVRENMKALRGSAEEKRLLQRYTRQLDDQENQLEAIRQDLAKLSEQQNRLHGELAKVIAALSFEITAAR